MTIRDKISVSEVLWNDAQRVSQEDMQVEQNHNVQTVAGLLNNHFGSGILLDAPVPPVLFDSDNLPADQAAILAAGSFDGTGLNAHKQPSDINLGNQIEVELTESGAVGRLSVKVAIIGLAFDGSMQSEKFIFYANGKQVSRKHFKTILTIFTNDFKGNFNCSRALGGSLVLREAVSFEVSIDPIMVSQDLDPDLFWRDFKVADSSKTLAQTIQTGLGSEFSVDGLNITTSGLPSQSLGPNDVTSQVGEKFLATTNNIQKITLLLAAQQNGSDPQTEFNWTGDLVVSIYPLQVAVDDPSDLVPDLLIDFDPEITPLAQISYNIDTLKAYGYVLNAVLQPIDFVFSNTAIGSVVNGGKIVAGKYYVITVKRSGSNTSGNILVGCGNNRTDNCRLTLFNGIWVDTLEQDLWFQVWTDAIKVASGQGYDSGNGIQLTKTTVDSTTGATIDYIFGNLPFGSTGQNEVNTIVVQAVLSGSDVEQDERTGNPVFSRQQFEPSVSLVTATGLTDLQNVAEPLILGAVEDSNPKNNITLTKTATLPGLAKGDTYTIVNPDPDLLSANLIGSTLIPNANNAGRAYRIVKKTVCTNNYGDVNQDLEIDSSDLVMASLMLGEDITKNSTQQKIVQGQFTMLEFLRGDVDADGKITANDINLITSYVNKSSNSFPAGTSFVSMSLEVQESISREDGYFDCSTDGYVSIDGPDGYQIVSANSLNVYTLISDGYLLTPTIDLSDTIFTQVPFPGNTYQIIPRPYWKKEFLSIVSKARQVPVSFTNDTGIPDPPLPVSACNDQSIAIPSVEVGRNDFYVPDNFIIGKGQILNPDNSYYKVDLEIGTIILELPTTVLSQVKINIMDKFVADNGSGKTNSGYIAMKYADGSFVNPEDLAAGKIRFGVSIMAIVPELDGYDTDGYGIIIDDTIGVYIDNSTGILTLSSSDLSVDSVFLSQITKLQIMVYLKKAGFNNSVIIVKPSEVVGITSS